MPEKGPPREDETQRPRFTARALLDVRDLLRHFQAKAAQSSTADEGAQEQFPSEKRGDATGTADQSCRTVHHG
jgi:hypothetical protein